MSAKPQNVPECAQTLSAMSGSGRTGGTRKNANGSVRRKGRSRAAAEESDEVCKGMLVCHRGTECSL